MENQSLDWFDCVGSIAEPEPEGAQPLDEIESDIDVSEPSTSGSEDSDSQDDSPANSDDVDAEDLSDDDERELWTENTHPVNIRPFTMPTGPNHHLPVDSNALDYLHLLWPEHLWETIATETNRYAHQKIGISGVPDPHWDDTTPMQVSAFRAINIMMGIKKMPAIWCYWSTNPALGCQWVSGVMTQTRYLKLSQYLHLRDNASHPPRDHPDYDVLYKLHLLLTLLPETYNAAYNPGCQMSVDEAMIGFKGRLSFRQYMPSKPTKWGVKVWELCDSTSGYCTNFQIYTGRSQGQAEHGLGYRVVMDLTEPYHHRNHHMYFDRFFSSPALAEAMDNQGTYCCSTVNLNRRGLPGVVRNLSLARGAACFQQKANLVVTVWKDKRQVAVLSTNSNAEMVAAGNPPKYKPASVSTYNRHMGGVDLSDQLRS